MEVVKQHVGSAGHTVLRVETFETRPPLTQAEENEELPFDVPIIPYQVATTEDPAPRQSVKWVGDDSVDIQVGTGLDGRTQGDADAVYTERDTFSTGRILITRKGCCGPLGTGPLSSRGRVWRLSEARVTMAAV